MNKIHMKIPPPEPGLVHKATLQKEAMAKK
jgi:hypothetical protein